MDQLARIARGARDVELVRLDRCRHSPHRDQPDALLAAIARFVERAAMSRPAPES
jgi:pimeloyl-ACP methyl ester carboxylesterase